jgi:hypothetical protein
MQRRGAWGRRGIALAAIALSFAIVAPELATPAGAAAARTGFVDARRPRPRLRHPARTEAQRKARVIAAMRAKGLTHAAALLKLQAAGLKYQGQTTQTKKPKAKAPRTRIQRQRALQAQRRARAARTAAARRRAALALAARRASNKGSSLSLPLLAFLAVLPFVLMGLYLLGADYLRRREQRAPRGPRKRGGPSLVITRVSNR